MWKLGRGKMFWMRRNRRRSYRVGYIQVCGGCPGIMDEIRQR
jgi:hypothetical protein